MKMYGKKTAAVLLALLILAGALLVSGCSTPRVAMTVDGTEYTTGEYLAFLYNSFYGQYVNNSLYYYDLYMGDSYDVWGQVYSYNDGEYDLAGLMKEQAKDSVKRAVAVERLMKENGITFSEEDQKTVEEGLANMPKDAYLSYGFNNESYARMYRELYAANVLFEGLYGEGGKQAVTADEMRKYFDENYISYKIITYTMQDSEGNELSADDAAKVTEKLENYLKLYEENRDFNAVIAKQKEDESAPTTDDTDPTAEDDTTTTTAEDDTTTTATDDTTTMTDDTTTTAEDTTPTEAGDGDGDQDSDDDDDDDDDDEIVADTNRKDLVASQSSEEGLIAELKKMEFNEVKIIEYKTAAGVPTKALVQRLDPEADRGRDEDGNEVNYFEDEKENLLHYMKDEDFDKLLTDKIATFQVDISDRAVNACDPQDFKSIITG